MNVAQASALADLLAAAGDGVLATLSAGRDGWPFASVVQFAFTSDGEPLFLLSDLAEHTRNLAADPRASLLVQERGSADVLELGRVTLIGTVERADGENLRARYLERHPQASQYFALADFGLRVLRVAEARYVAGFGDMGWISGVDLRQALKGHTI